MPGRVWKQLYEIAVDRQGFVTTQDAAEEGISHRRLAAMAGRGLLEHTSFGVYRMPEVPVTQFTHLKQATLWPRAPAVISHRSALDVYDLCDVNPAWVDITVPEQYRERRPVPKVYRLHHRTLLPGETTVVEDVPVITVYRALRDCVEIPIGDELIDQALQAAEEQNLITATQRLEIEGVRAFIHRNATERWQREKQS
jgi:predicted transcriptional regulator of viral defense system